MSDPGDRPGNVVDYDVVSTAGADLATEDEEVVLFVSRLSIATS